MRKKKIISQLKALITQSEDVLQGCGERRCAKVGKKTISPPLLGKGHLRGASGENRVLWGKKENSG